MKSKVIFSMLAALALPIAGVAANDSDSAGDQATQVAELKRLLAEVNTAQSDQKIGAIITLLNKLVEERVVAIQPTQPSQQTPATNQEKGMCKCCDMTKEDHADHQH